MCPKKVRHKRVRITSWVRTRNHYGNNISPINKKILSDIAKEKGLKEDQMYINLQSESYSMEFKKAK